MKITDAFITLMPRPMPHGMFDPMPEVIATFEDGTRKSLFSFYPGGDRFESFGIEAPPNCTSVRIRSHIPGFVFFSNNR